MVSNLRQFRRGMVLAVLRCVVIAPIPWMFKEMIDAHIPDGNLRGVFQLSGLFLVMLVLHYLFAVAGAKAIAEKMANLILQLRADIFDKLNELNFAFLDKQRSGRLLSKYAFDTQKVEMTMMQTMNQFLPNLLYSACITGLLVWMNWRLTIVLLLMIPLFAFMRTVFRDKIRERNERSRLSQEKLSGAASEVITALRLIRSFGQEDHVIRHVGSYSETYAQSRFDLTIINSIFGTFTYVSTQFLALVTVAGGAILVIQGQMTLGTLTAFMAGLPIIMMPIHLFVGMAEQYFSGQASYRSIQELLGSTYVEDWSGTQILPDQEGRVEFRDVTFAYDGDRPAVKNLSLTVAPGEHLALVGPSGAGKSTVTYLLLGLYQAQSGQILIDGVDQNELDMKDFRRHTAVVPQDSLILSGTIADNIRFARPDATDEEVREAARLANADEFIDEMTEGYETLVGERGVMLSGGQRQRISIARAILRNPRILILDEATSSLDTTSERLVQEALNRLATKRTVITIAHRLSTIRDANRIVVLRHGEVVEQGTYRELVAAGGAFSDLLRAQHDGVLPG